MPAYLPSELPVRAKARQHLVMLFLRKPRRAYVILVLILALLTLTGHWYFIVIFLAAAGILGYLRWNVWHAERIILTGKRIIHVTGVIETTRAEASLRLDRVSGIRLIETVFGRWLGYATIEVEAPGDHPGLRRLFRMSRLGKFYLELRQVVFEEDGRPDPDDFPGEYITEPLPRIPVRRDWLGRRLD